MRSPQFFSSTLHTRREQEYAELEAVLAALSRSPLVAKLLAFLCEKSLAGQAEQLTEFRIAVDLFGRSEDFDRTHDAIARVEAHRLRKKLKQYYASEGKDHAVQIELPPGSYIPVFQHRDAPADLEETHVTPPAHEASENRELEILNPEPIPSAEWTSSPQPTVPALPPRGNSRKAVLYVAGTALAALLVLTAIRVARRQTDIPPPTRSSRASFAQSAMPAVLPGGAVRILCGYSGPPHIGKMGEIWGPDQYFREGGPWPARHGFVRRTNDPFLFQYTRNGDFSYSIPVSRGVYELHLYFVENDYGEELGGGENSRTFLITLNGQTLFASFDPISDAGGPRIADERVIRDVQPAADGAVHLSFRSRRGQPTLSAIELLPGTPHRQLPIRLAASLNSYTDRAGQVWAPDNYYLGGVLFTDKPAVEDTRDLMLFASERAGNFTYALPVDPRGSYAVTLYFAETYFGPAASGVGGIGSRVFNVFSNGKTLLDQFDVFREAGSLHPVKKTFHGIHGNAQGKILLTFEPVANYASVFAIEVVDESE